MAKPRSSPMPTQARTNARLAAVQALYQMETTGSGVESVVLEFLTHRLGSEVEGRALHDADSDFFSDIVRGVLSLQEKIDRLINANLANGWKLSRLDSTARGILRAASYELVKRPDVPGHVVIDEYIEIANAFFEDDSPKFINAVLDSIYREVRTEDAPA